MNSPEDQLADLLHSRTPQPPASIRPANLAELAITGPAGAKTSSTGSSGIRPALLVLAAACVVAIPVATIVLSRHHSSPINSASGRTTISATPSASSSAVPTSSAPVVLPPVSATPSSPVAHAPACKPTDLTARVVRQAEAMEQMFVQIRLTNIANTPCTLSGYPAITAWPDHAPHSQGQFPVQATHGGTYFQADPGAQLVLLNPHQTSSFAVQTGLAYNGGLPRINIHELDIKLGGKQTAIPVQMPVPNGLIATTPTGQPIPLRVSALTTP
jgi:hypothetical protein